MGGARGVLVRGAVLAVALAVVAAAAAALLGRRAAEVVVAAGEGFGVGCLVTLAKLVATVLLDGSSRGDS